MEWTATLLDNAFHIPHEIRQKFSAARQKPSEDPVHLETRLAAIEKHLGARDEEIRGPDLWGRLWAPIKDKIIQLGGKILFGRKATSMAVPRIWLTEYAKTKDAKQLKAQFQKAEASGNGKRNLSDGDSEGSAKAKGSSKAGPTPTKKQFGRRYRQKYPQKSQKNGKSTSFEASFAVFRNVLRRPQPWDSAVSLTLWQPTCCWRRRWFRPLLSAAG